MKKNKGFLLLEALIALSLLALGVGAVAEAFAQSHQAAKRGDNQARLAECAQMKLAASVTDCENEFQWRENIRALSPRIEMVVLTASWQENGSTHEQTFETVRRATKRF